MTRVLSIRREHWSGRGSRRARHANRGARLTDYRCVARQPWFRDDRAATDIPSNAPRSRRVTPLTRVSKPSGDARHGFGRGEYKYFAYPLPELVAALRTALYPPLAEIANDWNDALGVGVQFPRAITRATSRAAIKPGRRNPRRFSSPMGPATTIVCTKISTENTCFPLQVTLLLSCPGEDFTGGEFVLTEQRPRNAVRGRKSFHSRRVKASSFPVHHRPVRGTRGTYRVNMRHGVSRLRSGSRHTLGIIFHDAK